MIVVFGSINLDLIFSLPRIPSAGETVLGPSVRIEPGGKGANQAVAAARDGVRVMLAGAVGRDALADAALRLLRQDGVVLSRVAAADAATGCAAISVDPEGNNAISVGSGANLLARSDQVEDSALTSATTLVVQMEVPAAETAAIIHRARQRGARIVLNLSPAAALPRDALRAVDVLVANETEAAFLCAHLGCSGDAAGLAGALGIAAVRTLGAAGLEATASGRTIRIPARKITPVDTTAAGDCFVGVLAAALDRGAELEAALRRANTAAALCCAKPGSQDSAPTAAEIDAFL
jgi:ribokinase